MTKEELLEKTKQYYPVVTAFKPERFLVKKGMQLYCCKTLIMDDGTLQAIQGKVYLSEEDGFFTNEKGNKYHRIGEYFAAEYFILAQEKVNNVSQINQSKNEHNKKESSQTNDTMDSDTGGTRGQEIRSRTKSGRVVCEIGLAQSGREISKTRRGRKRDKAEIGERFL